jgi:hypothetical protein
MFLTQEAFDVLSKLNAWAKQGPYGREAREIIAYAVERLAFEQLEGVDASDAGTDVTRAIVRQVLTGARRYSPLALSTARQALQDLGYGAHVPPTHAECDVTFGGATLRLTLPLSAVGVPYGLARALADAISDAQIKIVESPEVPADGEATQ